MKLYRISEISTAARRSHSDVTKAMTLLGIQPKKWMQGPVKQTRWYTHAAFKQIVEYFNQKPRKAPYKVQRGGRQTVTEPVQLNLPLQSGVDIDKAHTQAPTPAPVAPDVQAEMLSVLRSIDEKLGQLLLAWK